MCQALLHVLTHLFFMLCYEETRPREVSNLSRVTQLKSGRARI